MHEGLDGNGIKHAAVASRIHVLLKILVHVLEDEHELVLGVDDIVQADNVLVLQLFHQRDFADGGTRCAFFGIKVDLFQSNKLAGLAVATFEDLYDVVSWW